MIHTHALRVEGYSLEEIDKIRNLDRSFISDEEYRIYQYSIKSLTDAKSITDDEFRSFKEELKLTDRNILEIQEAIAMSIELSVFGDALNIPLEPWYYEMVK